MWSLLAIWAVSVTLVEQTITFDGSHLPAAQTLPWGAPETAETTVAVVGDALYLVDRGTQQGQLRFISYPWGLTAGAAATVTALVKVGAASGPAGVCLVVADGAHEACLDLYPDRLAMHAPELSAPVRLDDDFHTLTVRLGGGRLTAAVDGRVLLDLTGRWTQPAHQNRCLVGFGSLSSPATGEAWWRRVAATVSFPEVTVWPHAEQTVVYRQPDVYACFPSLLAQPDGSFVSSFGTRARRSHIDPTGGSTARRSVDGGRTWQELPAGYRVVDPATVRADGNLAQAGAIGWTEAPAERTAALQAAGWEVRPVRDGVVAYLSGARSCVRRPDGSFARPWTPIALPPGKGSMAYHQAAVLHVGNGLRLVAIYTVSGRSRDAYVLRSTDDGDTWQAHPLALGDDTKDYNETALAQAADGRLVALLRTAESKVDPGWLAQCESSDGGITWSAPRNTGLWGYPAHLLTLPDGRLLATYGYRRAPMGIRAAVSRDGGRTWDAAHEVVLRADGYGNGSDLGYPLTQRLPDGQLLTVYYFNDVANVTHIAATRWRLDAPTP
ncbi:MAG: exo-alpha-sialidase [Fimbriimonadaceae bacterium]|nr:exo-alpha-sialidase [Fimbriimonadaceae bacterium]